MIKRKFLKIPKSPVADKKNYKRKVRRSWKINPVEKIKESKKRYEKEDYDWKKSIRDEE